MSSNDLAQGMALISSQGDTASFVDDLVARGQAATLRELAERWCGMGKWQGALALVGYMRVSTPQTSLQAPTIENYAFKMARRIDLNDLSSLKQCLATNPTLEQHFWPSFCQGAICSYDGKLIPALGPQPSSVQKMWVDTLKIWKKDFSDNFTRKRSRTLRPMFNKRLVEVVYAHAPLFQKELCHTLAWTLAKPSYDFQHAHQDMTKVLPSLLATWMKPIWWKELFEIKDQQSYVVDTSYGVDAAMRWAPMLPHEEELLNVVRAWKERLFHGGGGHLSLQMRQARPYLATTELWKNVERWVKECERSILLAHITPMERSTLARKM